MRNIGGIVFVLLGLAMLGALGYGALNEAGTVPGAVQEIRNVFGSGYWWLPILGLAFLGMGLFSVVSGALGRARERALAQRINAVGTATQGTVTYVDRNYSVTINERPIYSIVECKFTDATGKEHVSRKPWISTELVIRNQIEVGSAIDVKYLPDDPSKNIFLIPDPRTATSEVAA